MQNFSVCLVHEILNKIHTDKNTFEESWLLVKANDMIDATHKALNFGMRKEDTFANTYGEIIEWKFTGIRHIGDVEIDDECSVICSFTSPKSELPIIKIRAAAASTFR